MKSVFLTVMFSILRNILGASTLQSVMTQSLEYHRLDRALSEK